MFKKSILKLLVACVVVAQSVCVYADSISLADKVVREELITNLKGRVHQYALDNGMQVICIPFSNSNIVTVGSYVRVGSMHEDPTEQGMAHILEHMVFKGTKNRKEGELDRLCNHFGMRIGRDYNACTGHSCTFYYFKTDDKNWRTFADVVADSTQNLDVLPVALDSELQAIAQEIKMRGEDLNSFDFVDMLPLNHPCAHRIIGYKEEVLSYTADQVMAFYNKHYIPAKTTFFVCGNVDPLEVLKYAQETFAGFTRGGSVSDSVVTPKQLPFYAGFTTSTKTIYHTQETKELEFLWPGIAIGSLDDAPLDFAVSALERRLKQKYVDELGYCFGVGASSVSVGPVGYIQAVIQPRPEYYEYDFAAAIGSEVLDIAQNGISEVEFAAFYQDRLNSLVCDAEDPSRLISRIAFMVASCVDPVADYFANQQMLQMVTQDDIKRVAHTYLRPFLMNKAVKVPLPLDEQPVWRALQERVSSHEKELFSLRARIEGLALASYTDTAHLPARLPLDLMPGLEYNTFTLSNGLVVYWRPELVSPRRIGGLVVMDTERIEIPLRIAGKSFAWGVAPELLVHGTDQYTVKEFDDLMHAQGISLDSSSGALVVGALKNNFEDGLRLLRLALDKTVYDQEFFDRKKQETLDWIVSSKNDPRYRLNDYLNQTMYAAYPWKFSESEAIQNLKKVTLDDARQCISLLKDPRRVALVLTGDFTETEARVLAERYFGDLREQSTLECSAFITPRESVVTGHISLPIEQSLVYALRPGCVRSDDVKLPALELLAAYFSKKVWDIREQTGLFYSGGVRLNAPGANIPGLLSLAVQTTPNNVAAVVEQLRLLLESVFAPGVLTPELLETLKNEFKHKAGTYILTAREAAGNALNALAGDYSFNYDREFEAQVMALSFEDFQAAVQEYCDPTSWSFITIGQ